MVEINNQRKADSSICWRRSEDVADVRKPEIMDYDVIVSGSYLLITPITPRKLAYFKPKTSQINRRRTLPATLVGSSTASVGLKDFSPKSQDAGVRQIKERGALPMIDRGDINQAIDRCSNIWASLPGAGYGQTSA